VRSHRKERAGRRVDHEAAVIVGRAIGQIVVRIQHGLFVDVRLERADVVAFHEVGVVEQVVQPHAHAGDGLALIVEYLPADLTFDRFVDRVVYVLDRVFGFFATGERRTSDSESEHDNHEVKARKI
jgi:hypothetical protein